MRSSVVLIVLSAIAVALSGTAPASAVVVHATTVKPAITSGRLHSCALRSGGTVVCWGDNSYGQLGNNSIVQSPVPVQVHGISNKGFLSGVAAITAGNGFTCALLATKAVDCWGYGGNGELGTGGTARSLVPVRVHGVGNKGSLGGVTAISGANAFACALLANKTVACWGANASGQLGIHSNKRVLTPVAVHGLANSGLLKGVTAIAAGSRETPCALLAAKTVVCWGANTNGELGNNSIVVSSSVPVKVRGVGGVGFLGRVKALTGAGVDSSCALFVGGNVACWGVLISLGVNQSPGTSRVPLKVHGVNDVGLLGNVTAVVDHSDTPCALLSSGRVDCWGSGLNRLGNNSAGAGFVPVQVESVTGGLLEGMRAISAGEVASCALSTVGTVFCWGDNGNGELGNNGFDGSGRAVQVVGVNNVGFLQL